jgi:hypothetical protein
MIKIVKWGWGITLNWIQDIANREFHITPVITYSWVDLNNKDFKSIKHGWGLAFEGNYILDRPKSFIKLTDNDYK